MYLLKDKDEVGQKIEFYGHTGIVSLALPNYNMAKFMYKTKIATPDIVLNKSAILRGALNIQLYANKVMNHVQDMRECRNWNNPISRSGTWAMSDSWTRHITQT